MTTAKISGAPGSAAASGLAPHIDDMYKHPGKRVVVIGELRHVEMTVPIEDTEKEPSVKLALTELEVATGDLERLVREALEALHMRRTASGTLTEHGDVRMAESRLQQLGGEINAIEAARLTIAVKGLRETAVAVLTDPNANTGQLRHGIRRLIDRFDRVINGGDIEPVA